MHATATARVRAGNAGVTWLACTVREGMPLVLTAAERAQGQASGATTHRSSPGGGLVWFERQGRELIADSRQNVCILHLFAPGSGNGVQA